MSLEDVHVSLKKSVLPLAVDTFLREANQRVNEFVQSNSERETGFVPSDYVAIYDALRAICDASLSPGNSLCEWGSGLGVVSCLASMLGFTACGIEIESTLVNASRVLADDFDLPVDFVHGSFVPPGTEAHVAEAYVDNNAEYAWLIKDAENAYTKHGVQLDSFDIVFAYPWPGEEHMIERLFEDGAANGALLLMLSDIAGISVHRRIEKHSDSGMLN